MTKEQNKAMQIILGLFLAAFIGLMIGQKANEYDNKVEKAKAEKKAIIELYGIVESDSLVSVAFQYGNSVKIIIFE